MSTRIALMTQAAFCLAVILGSASTAVAADAYGTPAQLQQCVSDMQASGRGGVGDEENGVTAHDVTLWRCMQHFYRLNSRSR